MAAIWIVSEESSLAAILAHHVAGLGEIWTGSPDRASFKDAPPADLLLLVGLTETGGRRDALERLLAFVRALPSQRRAPAPVLFVAAQQGGAGVARLFDDRAAAAIEFPFDPDELAAGAAALLAASGLPTTLRERTREAWLKAEVERLYAGVDLPELRRAVDPRNAHRPVLFVGEAGSRRDLLARYVHVFAEPARGDFALWSLAEAAPGELERSLLERTAGRHTTVYLPRLERAPRGRQEELAHLLGASGALALEPIRWLASALHPARLVSALRELPWLRVELPPLRARPDRGAVIAAAARAAGERAGRELGLTGAARSALEAHVWPGNLAELDRVLDTAFAEARGAEIELADLPFARAPVRAPPAAAPAAGGEREPATDEDLMLATIEPRELKASELPPLELDDTDEAALTPLAAAASDEPLLELDPEPEPELSPAPLPAARAPASAEPGLRELLVPLAHELRKPLRAVRTYAGLVEQRPGDAAVRRELRTLVEEDLGSVDETLQRLERYLRLGRPEPRPFDLAPALASELDQRQSAARARELVVLRELDFDAPPLVADEAQIRFAIGALLDRALRLVPRGGDVYLGSAWTRKREGRPAGHRILLRFHSPEDVLASPLDEAESAFVEVVIARDLFSRAGGTFAIDQSGPQDNVILVELPG
ncbi:MAG TPA: hypothetical protein VEN47_06275 [Myxococcota bacterium]|nr:hypothetical protein [Myxococcota bacterium]